ncbi:hypothetical protein [Novosphingobium sp. 9]|uniref:hypothetical protein n=1 Tax=Novosphingobium sp. 9 TaxID=2025349 RepID=UPI0021B6D67D|nr:hypothetical protein [Novosphingobium sp. 9]
MGRKGRPSKAGKREKNGRRQRSSAGFELAYDKGSEWVQARRAKYGTHYNTALGRAFAAGLLADDEALALDRYQAGKRFARLYNRVVGGATYRCALDRSPRGAANVAPDLDRLEHDLRDQEWLFAAMASLDTAGCRPYFDQLITSLHTDHGPPWLDRLLDGGSDPLDKVLLDAAISALDILAPARRQGVILVERYYDAA